MTKTLVERLRAENYVDFRLSGDEAADEIERLEKLEASQLSLWRFLTDEDVQSVPEGKLPCGRAIGRIERLQKERSCPCLHTTPCHPRCTCVDSYSSSGCYRCATYGSPEQRKKAAERLAKQGQMIERLTAIVDKLKDGLRMVATLYQDDRPLPDGEGAFAWDAPFDWRMRSMKQEKIARDALAAKEQANAKH